MGLTEIIIEKIERSSVDWRIGASGFRNLKIQGWMYKQYGREEMIKEARELEQTGLLKIKWESYDFDIGEVKFQLGDQEEFYKISGKIPKRDRIQQQEDYVKNWLARISSPWLKAYGEDLQRDLEKGKELDLGEYNQQLFHCLEELDCLREPILKKVFSKYVFGGSKVFENQYQDAVIRIARRKKADLDDNMDDHTILRELFIEEYSQEMSVKGNLVLELEGKILDLSAFVYGVVLTSATIEKAGIKENQKITKVVTVENKANYISMPYEDNTLIIFSHGYFSPKERVFLKRLYHVLKDKEVQYYHTGDLDFGGVRIFQFIKKEIFPEVQPFMMDVNTFERYKDLGENADEGICRKLRGIKEPVLQNLIDKICDEGLVIEQESFLVPHRKAGN